MQSLAKHRNLGHYSKHSAPFLLRRPVVYSVALLGLVYHKQRFKHAAYELRGVDLIEFDNLLEPRDRVALNLRHKHVVLDQVVFGLVVAPQVGLFYLRRDRYKNAHGDEVAYAVHVALFDLYGRKVGEAARKIRQDGERVVLRGVRRKVVHKLARELDQVEFLARVSYDIAQKNAQQSQIVVAILLQDDLLHGLRE